MKFNPGDKAFRIRRIKGTKKWDWYPKFDSVVTIIEHRSGKGYFVKCPDGKRRTVKTDYLYNKEQLLEKVELNPTQIAKIRMETECG